MNNCSFTGNITKDAVLRYTKTGIKVVDFFIVATEVYGDKAISTLVKATIWRDAAEKLAPYLKRGRKMSIHGVAVPASFAGKDGPVNYLNVVNGVVNFEDKKPEEPANTAVESDETAPY